MEGRGEKQPRSHFDFDAMLARVEAQAITARMGRGTHFWDERLPWNK
jgi:hypothetical protein